MTYALTVTGFPCGQGHLPLLQGGCSTGSVGRTCLHNREQNGCCLGIKSVTAMAGATSPKSEPAKRPRQAMEGAATRTDPPKANRELRPLTVQELTRGFLAHEDELQSMLHQLSIVHKLPLDGPLAAVAQEAIQVWLKQHVPGKPHPSGSPSAAVAKEVLPFLIDSQKPEPITEKAWKDFLTALRTIVQADDFQAVVSQELALFSARANAKKTHLILELRMKMHSFLVPHSSTYIKLIEDFEGETLGKRPMGALARKARGLSASG